MTTPMEVSKLTLDRNAYVNTAMQASNVGNLAAQANAYNTYLDPTMLTKAYFDSKLYHNRASNYAFDFTKFYGTQQQQQQLQQHQQHLQQQHQQFMQQQQQHLQQQLQLAGIDNSDIMNSSTEGLDMNNGNNNNNTSNNVNATNNNNNNNSSSNNNNNNNEKTQMEDTTIETQNQINNNYSNYPQFTTAPTVSSASQVTGGGTGDFRRPLTVLF